MSYEYLPVQESVLISLYRSSPSAYSEFWNDFASFQNTYFLDGGLIDGVKRISDDNEYSDYPQKFVSKLEKGIVCENIRKLARTSEEEIVRKRALNLFI